MTAVFGLGFGATLNQYAHDPALNGIFSDLDVYPSLYDPNAVQRLLASRPEIAYYYDTAGVQAQLADGHTFGTLFTAGDTRRITPTIFSGRWFHTNANELVVSQYALRKLNLQVGERVPLVFTQQSGQQITITYTIVGTLYMTQQPLQAYVPLSSLTAHIVPVQLLGYTNYEVTLRPAKSPQAFDQALQTATSDRIGVNVYDLTPQGGVERGP